MPALMCPMADAISTLAKRTAREKMAPKLGHQMPLRTLFKEAAVSAASSLSEVSDREKKCGFRTRPRSPNPIFSCI